jgi:predicted molibdopterin-dependent oxidoreductase YjgC
MSYNNPSLIFNEYSKLWPDISGITYDRIEKKRLAWPCPSPNHSGTKFLYEKGFAKGKPPFTPVSYLQAREIADSEFPYILTTGRNLYQYHTGTMTRRIAAIESHAGKAYVEMNTDDAKRMGIKSGDLISVSSRRGSIRINARVTRSIMKGIVFIPMHYCEAAANMLTIDAFDPKSKIPEYKACAVRVEK